MFTIIFSARRAGVVAVNCSWHAYLRNEVAQEKVQAESNRGVILDIPRSAVIKCLANDF